MFLLRQTQPGFYTLGTLPHTHTHTKTDTQTQTLAFFFFPTWPVFI